MAPHEDADDQSVPPDAAQLQRLRDLCNPMSESFAHAKDINDPCKPYLDSKRESAKKEPSTSRETEHSAWRQYYDQKGSQTSKCPDCEYLRTGREKSEKTVCAKCAVVKQIFDDLRKVAPSLSDDEAEQFAKWIVDWELERMVVDKSATDCRTGRDVSTDDSLVPCSSYALDLILSFAKIGDAAFQQG